MSLKKLILIALTSFAIHLPMTVQAESTSKIQQAEPPQVDVSGGQKWQTYLQSYCLPNFLPKEFNLQEYLTSMNSKMNIIAAAGWELVSLNQVSSCFLASFKAPKKGV